MLSRSRSSDSIPPLQSMAEVRVKKEKEQAHHAATSASAAATPLSPPSHQYRIKTSDSPRNPAHNHHNARASPRHSLQQQQQQQPVFSDETPPMSQEEYAMQWNIVASASEPQPHHSHGTSSRSVTTCPVRGCSQRYVNKKSLQKHMLTMHRGAKATREMAASLQTTPTGRAKKPRASSSSGEVATRSSTPTSTPRKSPRKPMSSVTASQSPPPKLSHVADGTVFLQAASDDEDDDDGDDNSSRESDSESSHEKKGKSRAVTKPMTMPSYFDLKVSGNAHLPIKSGRVGGALAAAAGVSASIGRLSAAAPTSSSSSTPRQQQHQQQSSNSNSRLSITDTTAQYPHPNRTFPSYLLAQAFPAATKDGSHPLLALLTKNFSSYMHTPLPTQSDRFTVDELFVAYLLHKYDARAFIDRLGYQSLLARCMWIRGGLERWARNWKRYASNDSPARPSARSRRSNSSSDLSFQMSQESFGSDEDDEEAFWRRFTLASSYSVTLLLRRIESFLTVTFEHGEGRSVPAHEQVEKKNIIAHMRKWVQTLKKGNPQPKNISNPIASASAATTSKVASTSSSANGSVKKKQSPSDAQFSPTKFLRPTIAVRRNRSNSSSSSDSSSSSSSSSASSTASSSSSSRSSSPAGTATAPSASQEAAAALAASNTAFASLVAADRSKNWTKASLEQLNSLLLSNDGKVDRNLTLRQIADTLGKTTDEVRFQVTQIRKLKEIEESRASSRVEREKLEQMQEKVREREAKKLATSAAKSKKSSSAASAASPSPSKKKASATPTVSMLDVPMHFEFSSLLDSSIVPTVGLSKRRRKRKAGSIDHPTQTLFDAQLAAPRKGGNTLAKEEKIQMQQMKAATVAAALAESSASSSKKSKKKEKELTKAVSEHKPAVITSKSPKRKKVKEDDEEEAADEARPGSSSQVAQPAPKKQRKSKSTSAAAMAPPQQQQMSSPFPPQQHQYAMMPYPNFYPGAYPSYPHMMPPQHHHPAAAASLSPTKASSSKKKRSSSSSSSSKSKSSEPPVAAAAQSQPPTTMYPGYLPPFAHPWGGGGMAAGPPGGGPPPFPAPVGPDGRPMQWSWMLVPVPAPPVPHPSQMVVIDDDDDDED